ncbi:Acriflavin resistance protein [hydrothermal vent metagenome]|uniref:Acriflavin resistance protein n=1 Tax=hydrothermal vent metagenome TaxID=652676 RepID=A0A3B0RN67_9ZZZZ
MKGLIAWFAKNDVAANLLMITIAFLGLFMLKDKIVLEVFPEFDMDIVTINVPYRGSTPVEVEEGVVIKVEEAIFDLAGIEELSSTSSEGSGSVMVEVAKGYDPRDMLDDIKNRVDSITTFPDEAERPTYSLSEHKAQVITVVIAGALSEREIRRLGERVRDDLTTLPGITQVFLKEVRPYEISVEVSEATLQRHGLTFAAIATAIRRSSLDLPAGTVKTRGGEILLRTKAQAYTGKDFEEIPVFTREDGTALKLGDVANVIDGFEDVPIEPRFNGKPAVMLDVFRSGDQSAIELADTVKEYLEEARGTMPPGVELSHWRDRSKVVKGRLNTLMRNGIQGGILVFLLLTMFLRLRVAFWVCVGIPVSFLGAIALMPLFGVTINLVSLFAFILVLGIVVDDAIVTGENIYTHSKRSNDPLEAAIKGTQEVAVPVVFGVLTTVAAFAPLLMMEGRRAPLFAQIPLVVIPVLLFSLIESKLVLPAHLKHLRLYGKGGKKPNIFSRLQGKVADSLVYFIDTFYRPALAAVLKRRYLALSAFVGAAMIVVALVYVHLHFTFFPRVQSEVATATLIMPLGTPFEVTADYVGRINEAAEDLRAKYVDKETGKSVIKDILSTPGSVWGSAGSNTGRVTFEIVEPEKRSVDVTSFELVKEWRESIGALPGVKELSFRSELGRGGDPVDIQLKGVDFETLSVVVAKIKTWLTQYPGVFDITDSFEDGKEEIKLTLKPKAYYLGIKEEDLARQVRQAFFGAEAQRIQRGREDVRVMVRYPEKERRTLASLENMKIRTESGTEVPFSEVADMKIGRGFSSIKRVGRMRTINVRADIDKKAVNVMGMNAELGKFLKATLRGYPGVSYSFEGEAKEQRKSFGSLTVGVIAVFFIIYVILAIPFRSYSQPLIVMSVIPFGLLGAFVGHFIVGISLSIMSILGMLALTGVVVNDSLVMVDFVNQRIKDGMPLDEAVRIAGPARFRAIILTSLTTFVGLVPLIFEQSTQAQFLIPMAVSLGFGVLIATVFTLFLVPVNYMILNDIKGLYRRLYK